MRESGQSPLNQTLCVVPKESFEGGREPHLLFWLSARMTDPQYNRSESEILNIKEISQPVAGDVSRPQGSIAEGASPLQCIRHEPRQTVVFLWTMPSNYPYNFCTSLPMLLSTPVTRWRRVHNV